MFKTKPSPVVAYVAADDKYLDSLDDRTSDAGLLAQYAAANFTLISKELAEAASLQANIVAEVQNTINYLKVIQEDSEVESYRVQQLSDAARVLAGLA